MNDGEARLLEAVFDETLPEPELLARYVEDPGQLTAEERDQVEAAIQTSPRVADEVRTLRTLDVAAFAAAPTPSEAPQPGFWEWFRRLALEPRLLAGAVAAAAVLWWILPGATPPVPTVPRAAPQVAEVPAPDVAEPVLEPPDSPPTRVAEAAPEPAPAPEATTPEPAIEPGPKTIATSPPPAPVREVPKAPAAPPDADAAPEPILLAMALPTYQSPPGSPLRGHERTILRGDEGPALELEALAPDHVTRSATTSPTLHWSIDRLPEVGAFSLTVLDGDDAVVMDRPLALPTRAGIQRTSLSALGIVLPEGRELRWSIALRTEADGRPLRFDFGWLEVVPPGADLAAELADAGPGTRPATYASAGYYHDALDSILIARERHPNLSDVEPALQALLQQAK